MSLSNPNLPVTEARLQEFYQQIKPYLGLREMPSGDMSEIVSPLPVTAKGGHKYDTAEQIVGEWVDGSTLYEKTVVITTFPNNEMTTTPHNISNLNEVVSVMATLHTKTSLSTNAWTLIPRVMDNATTNNIAIDILPASVQLKARTMDASSFFDKAYVTIQYTKTA